MPTKLLTLQVQIWRAGAGKATGASKKPISLMLVARDEKGDLVSFEPGAAGFDIVNAQGTKVDLTKTTDTIFGSDFHLPPGSMRWNLTPKSKWTAGVHQVLVGLVIKDGANSRYGQAVAQFTIA